MSTGSETSPPSSNVGDDTDKHSPKPLQKKKGEFLCTDCNTWLVNRSSLHYHSKKHSGKRDFKCQECEKTFISFSHLKRHLAGHKDEEMKKSPVKALPGAPKVKKNGLKDERPRPFSCHVCVNRYMSKYCLDRHFKKVHQSEGLQSSTLSPPEVLDEEVVDGFEKEGLQPLEVEEDKDESEDFEMEPTPRLSLVGEPRFQEDDERVNPEELENLKTPEPQSPPPPNPGLGWCGDELRLVVGSEEWWVVVAHF